MNPKTLLVRGFELLLLLSVLALVVGSAIGQPVVLSYVETDSMEPTLEPGDGFVAIPQALAGPVEVGDVVVYDAREIDGGGLTTHRIVGETEAGYITRGDGNPATDQDGPEPPVSDAQVVAVALQIRGDVVVLPGLGSVVETVDDAMWATRGRLAGLFGSSVFLGSQGLLYILLAGLLAWYGFETWRERKGRARERERSRSSELQAEHVLAILALVVVVGLTVNTVLLSGVVEFNVLSATFDSPGARVIPAGTTESTTYTISNGGILPVVTYLEPAGQGVAIDQREVVVPAFSERVVDVTLSAPPEIGWHPRYLRSYRYLALLPLPVIRALYLVHPWAPILVTDLFFGGGVYLVGRLAVGRGRVRHRSRQRESLSAVLRRHLPW